jgi:ribonuclease VapC
MIIDSSAIVAILRSEADAQRFSDAIAAAEIRRISAANYLETAIAIDASHDPIASHRVDEIIVEADIVIEPVTEAQARLARAAYRDFGRTSGHKARLNFGDCFAYALAKAMAEPLLFKGDDFAATDVKVA